MTWESVDFPEPFGPMMAWTSPLFTVSVSPWRISRSSTRTCRSLTSSSGIFLFRLFLVSRERRRRVSKDVANNLSSHPSRRQLTRPPRDKVLSNRSFERNRDQLLRFHRELHRQLLQHGLHKTVDDEADGFFLAEPALDTVEQDILGDLRGGRLVLEGRRRVLCLDIGHGVRAAFVADQQRVAGREIPRAG